VSFDSVDANRRFRAKCDFPFTLLCDTEKALAIAYGAAADANAGAPKRITVVVDPDGKVAKVYPAVKPAEHPRQVLDDL
jgi:peroxiredoxin Q/BCP